MSPRKAVPAPELGASATASVVDALGEVAVPGVVKLLSKREAERMTQEIKLTASGIRNNLFKLRNQIEVAKASNVWRMMGFASWTAYLSDTLAEEPMRVSREERLELVGYLAGEGMSVRAIAPIVGIGKSQVSNDLAELSSSGHLNTGLAGLEPEPIGPGVTPSPEEAATAPETPTTGAVTLGLDGKKYTKPDLRPVTLTAITDDARAAGIALRKAVDRLDRIRNDERFEGHRAAIIADLRPHLDAARDVLNDFGVEHLLIDPSKEN